MKHQGLNVQNSEDTPEINECNKKPERTEKKLSAYCIIPDTALILYHITSKIQNKPQKYIYSYRF